MEWILGALLGGFFALNALATPHKASEMAEKALRERYPNATVAVKIEGKRGRSTLKGRFKRIQVELADLTIDDLPFEAPETEKPKSVGTAGEVDVTLRRFKWSDLPVDEAHFLLRDVEYDFNALKKKSQLRIVKLGEGHLTLRLKSDALQPLVQQRTKNLTELVINLNDNQITATGKRVLLGVGAPFELKGTPAVRGREVWLDDTHLKLSGFPLPKLAADPILRNLNPLYTFDPADKWPFVIKLTSARANQDVLEIEANLGLRETSVTQP